LIFLQTKYNLLALKQFLSILLICTSVFALNANPHLRRNYAYRYFSTRDGLAQMQVMCAFQDRDGYMWFGTKGGISRWDGSSFKNYTPEDGLPLGETVNISEWDTRKLIFTQRKMSILLPNDSIILVSLPNKKVFYGLDCRTIPLDNNRIMLLGLDNEFDVWRIPKQNYNYIFDFAKLKFIPLVGFDENIIKVEKNRVFTQSGVFDWDGKRFVRRLHFPFKVGYARCDKDGKKYVLSPLNQIQSKLFKFEKGGFKQITKRAFNGCFVGNWLPDGSFLFLNSNEHEFYPQRVSSIKNNLTFPNFSFVDKENNLWIGTENGLYNYFNLNIEEINLNIGEPDNIWSIVEDNKGNMWLGSYGNGLWIANKSNVLKKLDFSTRVKHPHQDASKLIYMGSTLDNTNGVYITNCWGVAHFKNSRFVNISNTPAGMYSYYDTKTKEILYAGVDTTSNRRGLFIGVDKNKKFYSFGKGFPLCIAKDCKGRIRVGSFRGQGIFTGDSIISDTLKREYTGVVCMATDNKGRLWKGTEKGIYVELPNGHEFRVSPKQLTESFTSLVVYKNKYVIAGGTHGFAIVDIEKNTNYKNFTVINIGSEGGFTGLESGQNGICVDSQGYVWLATALNMLKFNPDEIVRNHLYYLPTLRIDQISYSTNNTNWSSQFFSNNKKAKIGSDNKFFRIDYIANSISAPKSLRFKYRLVGFSDKWSEPVYTKSVIYTNIGFGKYRFEVQCSLDGMKWSPLVSSPEIEIVAPIYFRPFAFILYLTILVALIVHITRVIVKKNQRKSLEILNRQKLENELQINTLRSKVIPHFTKNVLSAIGYYAMTDKLKASHYISLFSEFTQRTLTNADKNYISLNEEIKYIEDYLELEKMRFEEKFDFYIHKENNQHNDILIPSMTLHTYCDNAIRHGLINKDGKGILIVKIITNYEGVIISVEDNGIGRKRAAELGTHGNGQGLKLIQAQLNFYNQINVKPISQHIIDLESVDGLSLGTRIELVIPYEYRFTHTP
jgi:hypothetical protein